MPPSHPQFLGDLELAVMEHVWANGAGDVKHLHEAVGRPRRITLNTVQSTLKRLHAKGLLAREKVSHAYVYSAACTRAEFQRDALRGVVSRLMEGEPEAMLAAFVDLTERAGAERLEQLERLVAERLREGGDSEP